MGQTPRNKPFDLEERALLLAKDVIRFLRSLPRGVINDELTKQLVRSSGSVGANYIEAREGLSKKDFVMRAKISRKEAKESTYWLRLLDVPQSREAERQALVEESIEITRILGAIVTKAEKSTARA